MDKEPLNDKQRFIIRNGHAVTKVEALLRSAKVRRQIEELAAALGHPIEL